MLGAALVDRATSPVLVGPDWSVNMELCDVLNSNSSQVKDVVRRMKKQLNSKHSKVQLLTLTLLETIIKNCGDVVHMHVAEKDILHEMVKIVKKKPDFHVKEKILVLIDTWQEAFGGPRARYPQYYVAYQELLRAGVVFPQRLESSVPIFTPPQTKPLSYPQPVRKPETYSGAPESSARFDLPTLSTTEIQNARSVVDILAEMISAMDPTNKEGLKQEVIVDLVEQCRSYKQRVIQLVNSSSDERLLSQGLALHDDIQRVLAQRDAIASGIAVKVEKQMPVAGTPKVEIKAKEPQTNGRISTTASNASGSSSVAQSFPPATTSSNGPIIPPARVPQIDLLSGDFNPAEDENRLALVPVSIYSTTSTSDQNTLALIDMFPQNTVMDNRSSNSISPSYSTSHAHVTSSNAQMTSPPKLNLSPSFNGASPASPQFGGPYPIPINQPNMQQMKPLNLGNVDIRNGLSGEAFPPPPWEMQQADGNQPGRTAKTLQPAQVAQMGGAYLQQMQQIPQFASGYPPVPNAQMMAISPYQPQGGPVLGSQVQTTQIPGGGYIYERWVIPPADAQYYDQMRPQYPYPYPYLAASNLSPRAYGTAIQGGTNLMNVNPSYSTVLPSPLSSKQSSRPSRPEDKLFGDLVDFAKLKQNKPSR